MACGRAFTDDLCEDEYEGWICGFKEDGEIKLCPECEKKEESK